MYQVAAEYIDVIMIPQNELEEIFQNVRTILSTVQGTVPLDRNFGVDRKIVDLPESVAQAKITAAIVKAVNEQEPRARVTQVYYDNTTREAMDGILKPRVQFEIVEKNLRGYVKIED